MAHPLAWPGKYFFYPIGNTSAVCLTRDLAPEESAKILLLGCGDPRNVLYTIFCEHLEIDRTLDFTCCDIDPGILARNVLLFTMVADKLPHTTTIWNIFFHMYLDKDSHGVLVEQCRKLIGFCDSLQSWNASPYGAFIRMCTEYTLEELRRHWSLYVDMQDLPTERLKTIRDAFTKLSQSSSQKEGIMMSSARSSGPLMMHAMQVSSDQFKKYWKTGVTFSDHQQIAAATVLNPTFVYSLAREGCSVHYGLDPIVPFHLGALFGNAKSTVSVADIVKAAKAEFSAWCSAFQTSISPTICSVPVIRFFLGEATAVCRTLRAFDAAGALKIGLPVAQWRTQLIQLSEDEYISGSAPVTFNVIDTSNLDDHIGLLNVLIATVPLLPTFGGSGVLYTESLLFRGQDATKEFAERLHANITTVSLLLGLCPVDYSSGFVTRSNTHELMTYKCLKGNVTQFHQVTTWKSPTSGDVVAVQGGESRPPVFDPNQLGTLLYDIYYQLFEQENAMHFWRLNQGNMQKAISGSNIIHYMRESFVLFLKLVRDKLEIAEEQWLQVMDRFFALEDTDKSLPMDMNNYQDLCAHLHRHGVHTVAFFHFKAPKVGRFLHWDTMPVLARIILTVPREKLAVLESSVETVGTPPLQCDIRGSWSHNIFTAIHVAFGRVVPMGTKSHPWVVFKEDPEGWTGASSLVVSFTVATRLLTDVEPMENLSVCLSVRSTTGTTLLIPKLGMNLSLFSAKLMDESHVHVLPQQPLASIKPQTSSSKPPTVSPSHFAQIGRSSAAVVELDQECELVAFLACRVSVENEEIKHVFGSGAVPQIAQVSPCVMRITIGGRMQDLIYPFPVIGSRHKLRLARTSMYIEIVVPVSGPFESDGMKLNSFPVIGTEGILRPWNIHHLNLSHLPILDIKASKVDHWLNAHVGSMLSTRERSLRKKRRNDALMFCKDTLHTMLIRSAGTQGGSARRLFALRDEATNNCDTVFFISNLRFDLHCHTIVCDGFVLPLTNELLPRIESDFAKLVHKGDMVSVNVFEGEMQAWKQLIPAFVERCRSWKHRDDCEYKTQGKVPLTDVMEVDPLCSCGRGKDTEGMSKVALWRKLAPYVTRVALSPLFAVSYLETVGRDPSAHRCFMCRGKGKPKMMTCTGCKKVRYCSKTCQKKDWTVHKKRCKS